MKTLKGEFKIKRETLNRINTLLDIEDFETDGEKLEELNFKTDSTVFDTIIDFDKYFVRLSVCTGQHNAWVETIIIRKEDDCEFECEPGFEGFVENVDIEIDMFDNDTTIFIKPIIIE